MRIGNEWRRCKVFSVVMNREWNVFVDDSGTRTRLGCRRVVPMILNLDEEAI